jgi:hypothetical protein
VLLRRLPLDQVDRLTGELGGAPKATELEVGDAKRPIHSYLDT